jgi:xanthine dehydrogenase small subunit
VTVIEFDCNGESVACEIGDGESLLYVLRERLRLTSVKDGCAPQGQCGCCTVLVDGDARVACVTPAARVHGRSVTTVEGLTTDLRSTIADALCATGGTQCGFCTPGIVVRLAALRAKGSAHRAALDRSLAAHLCRCTGWQGIYEAMLDPVRAEGAASRDLDAAARRAELEGGAAQVVHPGVALGSMPFADDLAPTDALVAVPRPPGSDVPCVEAAGIDFVIADSLSAARATAGKTQGRRTTLTVEPPIPARPRPDGGVRLATSWVEPAYLEVDASWCRPGGDPASALANGGAFGGKLESAAPAAARELAERFDRPVRVIYSREDVVRLGPKRGPIAGDATLTGAGVRVSMSSPNEPTAASVDHYGLAIDLQWESFTVVGPPVTSMRAPWAETAVLIEGALQVASFDRAAVVDGLAAAALLDVCVASPGGAFAGARVHLDGDRIEHVEVRIAAGEPLDEVVLRGYCVGAAHMALGWVLTEGLTVDAQTGEIHDLTIRSFGVIRPKHTPPIEVVIVDDDRPSIAGGSDSVFAAVAAAAWIAIGLPEQWPARDHPVSRRLRR